MRAWEVGDGLGIESLRCAEHDLPAPGPGEALLRVRAAGLNHRDLKIVSGLYHGRKPPQRVPLADGVGEIVAVGPDVTGFTVGDRVSSVHFIRWRDGPFPGDAFAEDLGSTRDGWLADHILLPAAALVAVPDAISDPDAAVMPAAGVTAWSVIHDFGRVSPGDTVLTIGTGGVSLLAVQIARLAGARTILLSSSSQKLAAARAAGVCADLEIDTNAFPDWEIEVQRQTGGADIIVETVGNATLHRSIAASAINGRIGLIGALGGTQPPRLDGLIARNVTLKGIASGSRDMLARLLFLYAANGLRPAVGAHFEYDDAPSAYRALAAAGHVGKLAILMPAG